MRRRLVPAMSTLSARCRRTNERYFGRPMPPRDQRLVMTQAKSCTQPATRLGKLADFERLLLERMGIIPLYLEAWQQLQRPYVRGIEGNFISAIAFHRAWIDTNWRLS